jgi:hypothetical protein
MKICDPHWTLLNASVSVAGLGSLIPDDSATAMRHTIDRILTGMTIDNFDPVMVAAQFIVQAAVRTNGPAVLFDSRCPMCAINQDCPCPVTNCGDEFADRCVKAAVEVWKKIGNEVSS